MLNRTTTTTTTPSLLRQRRQQQQQQQAAPKHASVAILTFGAISTTARYVIVRVQTSGGLLMCVYTTAYDAEPGHLPTALVDAEFDKTRQQLLHYQTVPGTGGGGGDRGHAAILAVKLVRLKSLVAWPADTVVNTAAVPTPLLLDTAAVGVVLEAYRLAAADTLINNWAQAAADNRKAGVRGGDDDSDTIPTTSDPVTDARADTLLLRRGLVQRFNNDGNDDDDDDDVCTTPRAKVRVWQRVPHVDGHGCRYDVYARVPYSPPIVAHLLDTHWLSTTTTTDTPGQCRWTSALAVYHRDRQPEHGRVPLINCLDPTEPLSTWVGELAAAGGGEFYTGSYTYDPPPGLDPVLVARLVGLLHPSYATRPTVVRDDRCSARYFNDTIADRVAAGATLRFRDFASYGTRVLLMAHYNDTGDDDDAGDAAADDTGYRKLVVGALAVEWRVLEHAHIARRRLLFSVPRSEYSIDGRYEATSLRTRLADSSPGTTVWRVHAVALAAAVYVEYLDDGTGLGPPPPNILAYSQVAPRFNVDLYNNTIVETFRYVLNVVYERAWEAPSNVPLNPIVNRAAAAAAATDVYCVWLDRRVDSSRYGLVGTVRTLFDRHFARTAAAATTAATAAADEEDNAVSAASVVQLNATVENIARFMFETAATVVDYAYEVDRWQALATNPTARLDDGVVFYYDLRQFADRRPPADMRRADTPFGAITALYDYLVPPPSPPPPPGGTSHTVRCYACKRESTTREHHARYMDLFRDPFNLNLMGARCWKSNPLIHDPRFGAVPQRRYTLPRGDDDAALVEHVPLPSIPVRTEDGGLYDRQLERALRDGSIVGLLPQAIEFLLFAVADTNLNDARHSLMAGIGTLLHDHNLVTKTMGVRLSLRIDQTANQLFDAVLAVWLDNWASEPFAAVFEVDTINAPTEPPRAGAAMYLNEARRRDDCDDDDDDDPGDDPYRTLFRRAQYDRFRTVYHTLVRGGGGRLWQ